MPGQGHLYQNAVDLVPLIQLFNERQQIFGGGRVWQVVFFAIDAKVMARLDLVAYVDFRAGVVAGEDYSEAWSTMLRGELVNPCLPLGEDLVADPFAV